MQAFYTLLPLVGLVSGHGIMWNPPSRNAGPMATAVNEGGCNNNACMFFSQGCTIGCKCNEDNSIDDFWRPMCPTGIEPTNNDPKYRTLNIHNKPVNASYPGFPNDWTKYHPWRAPGTAKPLDSCGLAGGSTKNNDAAGGYGNITVAGKQGFPGSKLQPIVTPAKWVSGSVVEVGWGIAANHGGGYYYRLCPKGAELNEECFEKTPLEFVGDTSKLRWMDGHEVEIPATRLSTGTQPAGSTWTKNPIPPCDDVSGGFLGVGCDNPGPAFPPPVGCDETCWGYQPCFEGPLNPAGCKHSPIKTREIPAVVDKVQVPSNLPAGDYVVGWRWDCEHTPQVWSGCGDITIVSADTEA